MCYKDVQGRYGGQWCGGMYKSGAAEVLAKADAVAGESHVGGCQEDVPLTITPPSDKHRLDAVVEIAISRKGIVPKTIAQMRRGAAGFLAWKSATFSGAFSTLSAYSQEFPSTP